MSITNIEYGSLASSETLNNNFSYLDEKITDTSININTSISSILTNIATLNSRISALSNSLDSQISTINQKVETYRTKTKSLVSKANMMPNWLECESITITSDTNYVAASNGYVILVPDTVVSGAITLNGVSLCFKIKVSEYDNSSQLTVIPVKKNDTLAVTCFIKYAYFVPVAPVSVSGF